MIKKITLTVFLILIFLLNTSISSNHNKRKTDFSLSLIGENLFQAAYSYSSPCPPIPDTMCIGPWNYRCVYSPGSNCEEIL